MTRIRDPIATRGRLLQAAFREFHRSGYRGADLDRILLQAGVTKGALYHHFESKRGLAYAVIEEVVRPWILDRWLEPLRGASDPLAALVDLAKWGERTATVPGLALGCPLLALSQELAGSDEGFRLRLASIYEEWREGLARILSEGRARGLLASSVEPHEVAIFVVAAWQGSAGLAKAEPNLQTLSACRNGLERYLISLGP